MTTKIVTFGRARLIDSQLQVKNKVGFELVQKFRLLGVHFQNMSDMNYMYTSYNNLFNLSQKISFFLLYTEIL